jgi:hypothetical protein
VNRSHNGFEYRLGWDMGSPMVYARVTNSKVLWELVRTLFYSRKLHG